MKKFVLTCVLASTLSIPAFADEIKADIQDHFKTVTTKVPHTNRVCSVVEVPIYGEDRSDAAGAITGAIIGGVIGHQIGNGSGKDAATALGAIIGANKGGTKQGGVVGYRQEERCYNETTYEYFDKEVYSHSTIRWREGGREQVLTFTRAFRK